MSSKSLCANTLKLSLVELSFSFIVAALFIASLSSVSSAASPVSRVYVIAPASASLDENVTLRVVYENNSVVAGVKILIVSPSRESIVMLTGSNGEAEFNATYEGVYTYGVPDYNLSAVTTTNVIKPAEISNAQSQPVQQASPLAAMALESYSPWVPGLLVLFLVVFFLSTRNKKKSKRK